MKNILLFFLLVFSSNYLLSQDRIEYNNQELFLSGANLAWLSFANDIGKGTTDLELFADILLQIHENGGNSLRWWLHTNGTVTPEFSNDIVIGPGEYTIQDLRNVLDLAWEREVGIKLCLWSFDMLKSSLAPEILNRNLLLLTDISYTNEYIKNALIPMVDSLKEHPAIIAWEIFNEPEGMSNEFGWSEIEHIPMSIIQRFINLTSAAIHKADSTAQITNGCWSIQAMTDVQTTILGKIGTQFSAEEKEKITNEINKHYGFSLTSEEAFDHLNNVFAKANYNYYSDDRLIAEGGDSLGILDFYSVHYYDWAGTSFSPFHNSNNLWQLDKSLVLAEFHMKNTLGVTKENLYRKLYQNGYAGALAWSWTDNSVTQPADILVGMKDLWDNYKSAVDVDGIAGSWPTISIISPIDGEEIPDTVGINFQIDADDSDGTVKYVRIFANDSLIVELTEQPFNFLWENVEPGFYKIYALVTDNNEHTRKTEIINIIYGTPAVERLEAESATFVGAGITVKSDPTASSGYYLEMAAQSGTVTWDLTNNSSAGNYILTFGARLKYDSPKSQYIIVNDDTVSALEFNGGVNDWVQVTISVNLSEGQNTIQLALFWGWMDLDYLAVPKSVVTSVSYTYNIPSDNKLEQNYPNPFNPTTTIEYTVPTSVISTEGRNLKDFSSQSLNTNAPRNVKVTLMVYDILGRQIETLVNKVQPEGSYSVTWNAGNYPSGVYFYQLNTGDFREVKKMLLQK